MSRERVISAAVAMIDRVGADAVSMRALAAELGVTPMALYNHVADKRDLLAAAAEHILAEAIFDQGEGDWRTQVEACFRSLRQTCLRHPGAAHLMEIEGAAPTAAFAPMAVTLEALSKAGLEPVDALRAFFALVGFTLAQASYQTRGPFPDLEPAKALGEDRFSERLAQDIEAAIPTGEWDFDRAFEFGLSLILDGIERASARRSPVR